MWIEVILQYQSYRADKQDWKGVYGTPRENKNVPHVYMVFQLFPEKHYRALGQAVIGVVHCHRGHMWI